MLKVVGETDKVAGPAACVTTHPFRSTPIQIGPLRAVNRGLFQALPQVLTALSLF